MNDATRNKILRELDELSGVPRRPPGYVSTREWSDHNGVSFATAARRLAKMHKKGLVEKLGPVHDPILGKVLHVWRKTPGLEED